MPSTSAFMVVTLLLIANAVAKETPAAAAYAEGVAFHKASRVDAAIGSYRSAIAIDPAFVDAHYGLANALVKRNRYREAREHFARTAELIPGNPEAVFALGVVELHLGDRVRGVRSLEAAMASGRLPAARRIAAMEHLAPALRESGRYGESCDTYRELQGALGRPLEGEAQLGFGLALVGEAEWGGGGSGDDALVEEGVAQMTAACRARGTFRCHEALGGVLARIGKQRRAEREFEAAMAAHSNGRNFRRFYGNSSEPPLRVAAVNSPLSPARGAARERSVAVGVVDLVSALHSERSMHVVSLLDGAEGELFTVDGFLTAEECEALISIYDARALNATEPLVCFDPVAEQQLLGRKAAVTQNGDLNAVLDVSITDGGGGMQYSCADLSLAGGGREPLGDLSWSSSAFSFPGDSPVIDRMEDRIERLLGLPSVLARSTQLLEYLPGERYSVHTDCTQSLRVHGDDRAMTVLVYLNDVAEGGETSFPRRRSTAIRPRQGRAVVFSSLNNNGFCDVRTEHESLALHGDGRKMVIQKWYASRGEEGLGAGLRSTMFGRHTKPGQPYVTCDRSGSCRRYMQLLDTNDGPSPSSSSSAAANGDDGNDEL